MGHIYKWLGSKEQTEALWQNREALELYLARLKELMEKDNQGESDERSIARDSQSELSASATKSKNPQVLLRDSQKGQP